MLKAVNFLKTAVSYSIKDELLMRGAALSFYAIFSIPAATIIILTIISYYLGDQLAQQHLITFLSNFISPEVSEIVKEIIPAITSGSKRATSIVSIILLTISSSALFSHLIKTLNKILPSPKSPKSKLSSLLISRSFSFIAILFFVLLLFTSLIADTGLSIIKPYIIEQIPFGINLFEIISFGLSLLVTFVLFLFIFKFLPRKKTTFKESLFGALITTALFLFGRSILLTTLTELTDFSAFGAASTFIILLVWIFYSAQTVFFGAECIKTLNTHQKKN